MTLDPWRHPALVVVDMQNDFVREGAPLEVPEARATLPQHRQILLDLFPACRLAGGLPPLGGRSPPPPHRLGRQARVGPRTLGPPVWACRRGHLRFYRDVGRELDCADVVDEIYPRPGEYVVDKYGYGGFHKTSLDPDLLRSHQVESVIVTGTVTQVCVEETARQAFGHGYLTTVVADAVSSRAPARHRATLDTFAAHYGWVMSTEAVLDGMLTQVGRAAD